MYMCAGPTTGTYQGQILKENWHSQSSYQLLIAPQSAVILRVLPGHADETEFSLSTLMKWDWILPAHTGETGSSPSILTRWDWVLPVHTDGWNWVLPGHTDELAVFLHWYQSCAGTTSTEFMDTKVQPRPEDTVSPQSSNLSTLFRVDIPWKDCNFKAQTPRHIFPTH